jgi:hypothetical protein
MFKANKLCFFKNAECACNDAVRLGPLASIKSLPAFLMDLIFPHGREKNGIRNKVITDKIMF